MISAPTFHHHQAKEVPADDASVLQKKAGAKVGAVPQENNMLRAVRMQDMCNVENFIDIAGADAG
jgi:hypothetical protein